MHKIFIGLILIFLDFNLDFNSIRIGLIPDFIGYIYILNGLTELASESDWFIKIKPATTGMVIYSGFIYAMDLFGISAAMGNTFSYLLGLCSMALSLYITYAVVMGIMDIEKGNNWELNAVGLYSIWRLLAICTVFVALVVLIPLIGFVAMIIGLIINIYFLYSFNQTKNLYENYVKRQF